jgi:hypothetical protein
MPVTGDHIAMMTDIQGQEGRWSCGIGGGIVMQDGQNTSAPPK